eukprot:s4030_g2.t1
MLNTKSTSFQVFEVCLSQLVWHFATAIAGGLRHRLMVRDLSKSLSFTGHVQQCMVHLQLPRELQPTFAGHGNSAGYNGWLYMVLAAATVQAGANDQTLKGTFMRLTPRQALNMVS